MNVTLKNNTSRAIPIMLDHPAFRNRKSGFRRRAQTVIDQARDGSKRPRVVQREEPGSITLPPRGEVRDLHPAIKNCAQVRGLLARKAVSIIKATEEAAPPKSPPKRRPAKPAPAPKQED